MATGAALVGTYLSVPIAISLVTEISYLVALRQLSIPLGFIIGVVFLNRAPKHLQAFGCLIILTGVVLVSI